MRKVLSAIIVASMLLTLAGCKENIETPTDSSVSSEKSTSSSSTTSSSETSTTSSELSSTTSEQTSSTNPQATLAPQVTLASQVTLTPQATQTSSQKTDDKPVEIPTDVDYSLFKFFSDGNGTCMVIDCPDREKIKGSLVISDSVTTIG